MSAPLASVDASADICLLLEGTFPFVRGGVSSWVNDMLHAFPEKRFAIVFLGSRKEDYQDAAYPLPDNVVHLETHFLYESGPPHGKRRRPIEGDAQAFAHSANLHAALRARRNDAGITRLIASVLSMLGDDDALNEAQFSTSRRAWDYITEQYREHCTDPSFTDYIWTVRTMHQPIWKLARIAQGLAPARVYHTVSTGYAGLLGAMLRQRSHRPLLVSEHGIYTKERKIELLQSQWLSDNRGTFEHDILEGSYFRELWGRFFEALGKLAYHSASDIISLYEGNRRRQIDDGAPAHRTHCIPNGVDIARFGALRTARRAGKRQVVAMIGRVVPIKDVKTFIRSIFIAAQTMPDIEGWIVGPEEEDRGYANECLALARNLGLAERLRFRGFQRIDDVLPHVDVLALTSISEALPLVVLEGFAAGIPAVVTDVGSCRQLIEGQDGDDRALGMAGSVVPLADPIRFARALTALLSNETQWRDAQAAGLARVQRYYTRAAMVDSYRELYQRLLASDDVPTDRALPPQCPVAGQPLRTPQRGY
ncbi:MAG: GT4 family glycosyltransferase PelF [Janthinobacterium lividum]